MVFLLGIGLTASTLGRGPSLVASALSVLAFDFFFVEPRFTFAVTDSRNLLTFAMMFGVGLLLSGLTARLRNETQVAESRAAQTNALYTLARDLGATTDGAHAARVGARHAHQLLGGGAAVVLAPSGRAAGVETFGLGAALGAFDLAAAAWATEHSRSAGAGTPAVPEAALFWLPLRSGAGLETVGAMGVTPAAAHLEQRRLLEAFARQLAVVVERAQLAAQASRARLEAQTEALRSSLLSTVSHDLRTPLASITGAATTLRDSTAPVPEPQRAELLDTICEEAERLERLVGNLLDMTRLESGGLQPRRDWVPVDELVGSALQRLETQLTGRPVSVRIAPGLPLLHVDPVLFEQVVINLLENALKYTPAASPIEVTAESRGAEVVLAVHDRGPGIPRGAEDKVFEKFFRGPQSAGVSGAGLGLAICKGIVEAHHGTVGVQAREGGGATFTVSLPMPTEQPK